MSKSVEEQAHKIVEALGINTPSLDELLRKHFGWTVSRGKIERVKTELTALLSAERRAGGIEATQRLAPIMADEDKEYRLRITSEYLASLRREL